MSDPSARGVPCPHEVRLPVLGVETTFATNAPEVLERVRETYGRWEALRQRPEVVTPSEAVVRIVVARPRPRPAAPPRDDGEESRRSGGVGGAGRPGRRGEPGAAGVGADPSTEEGGVGAAPARARIHALDRTAMRIEGPGGSGVADTRRLESRARVSRELVERGDRFVEEWLEPLTLFLLGSLDRQPVHASAIVRSPHFPRKEHEADERPRPVALLLAGPSGVGKSTLTYTAWRSGFGVLADEPVYVQLRPRLRVWGRRPRVHLPLSAADHFSELRGAAPTALSTGKTKIVIELGGGLPFAERAGICVLSRGSGDRPRLEPLSVEETVDRLTARLDPGYDLFADTLGERIARIGEYGAWSLVLAGPPAAALPLLEEAAAQVEEASARAGGAPHLSEGEVRRVDEAARRTEGRADGPDDRADATEGTDDSPMADARSPGEAAPPPEPASPPEGGP